MQEEIIIKNYDRERGCVDTSETSPYLGLDLDGKHYILNEDDYCAHSTEGRGGLTIPRTAFELVKYDAQTGTATAREVTDKSLVQRIAVEFHMQDRE